MSITPFGSVLCDARVYVEERSLHRVVGTAVLYACLLPPCASFLRLRYLKAFPKMEEVPLLMQLWLPTRRRYAAALGALGGALEDIHASLAFKSASQLRRAREPEMWTPRTLSPALAFFVNPLLALSCLDGEMKGSDSALALYERRPIQSYPFFAVLDQTRPSNDDDKNSSCRAVYRVSSDVNPMHLLRCRLDGGFYEIERNHKNDKWRVF